MSIFFAQTNLFPSESVLEMQIEVRQIIIIIIIIIITIILFYCMDDCSLPHLWGRKFQIIVIIIIEREKNIIN
jgi:hypothetical protein